MRWGTKYIIFLVLVCFSITTRAEAITSRQLLPRDSSYLVRSPGVKFLEEYRDDSAFDYEQAADHSVGLWDWIKRWVLERLFRMKISDNSLLVLDIVFYIFIFLLVGFGIYFFIRKGRLSGWGKKEKFFPGDTIEYTGEQGKDTFARLLAKAEQERNYELAVRISYSALLQMLDEKQLIRWDISKTNRSYIYEIQNREWNLAFEEISRIFDCVCYGEFPVDEGIYRNIKQYIAGFRKGVES